MFAFLIDPTGWTEIDGQTFAPGLFAWNSEVGKRSIGVSTFWFQAVCQNHIVWDATEVIEITRKHTAGVHDALRDVRIAIENLVTKREERRDGFVRVMKKAMTETLGTDAEEVEKVLQQKGIQRRRCSPSESTVYFSKYLLSGCPVLGPFCDLNIRECISTHSRSTWRGRPMSIRNAAVSVSSVRRRRSTALNLRPVWNLSLRELRVGTVLVKQFRVSGRESGARPQRL